jgi:hypothetical protein
MKKILFIIMATFASQLLFSNDIGNTYVINDDHVNVRTGPGLDNPVSFQLNKGDEVELLNRTNGRHSIGGQYDYWYLIKTEDGRLGSVFGSLISSKFEMLLSSDEPFTLMGPDFDPGAIGRLIYQINEEVIKERTLEARGYNSKNIDDLLEQNEAYASLYQEITDEIISDIQSYEDENNLQLELDPRIGIKIIEMENKTFLLYDIKYAELIDLDDTNFAALIASKGWKKEESEWPEYSYGIGSDSDGIYIIYPDGNYRSLSHTFKNVHPYTIHNRFEETLFFRHWETYVYRITDINGDDNPELWCSTSGYESGSDSIQFLTEERIYDSGAVDGSHHDEQGLDSYLPSMCSGPANEYLADRWQPIN